VIDYDFRDSGFINYDALNNIERELREQYAIQETEGIRYKRPEDLGTIFRTQAAKLAAQGVESVYDLVPAPYEFQGDDRGTVTNLLNKRTGDVLREARLREGWEEDPTAVAFKKTKNLEGETVNQPIELQSRAEGFDRWGFDTSVEGMAHYGINFVDGVPVFTPYYKDTASRIFGVKIEDAVKAAAAIAAAYYGGSYLLGGETAAAAGAGATGTGTAAAGTGATAGTAAGTTLATSTAVPGSLQAALPSLGVQTAATTAASTAIPGTFSAALPGLLSTTAAGAPIYFANAVPAEQLAYPSTQVGAGATPIPGSYQARLAELGVQTAATTAPATAAAGSFQAALPSLLAPAATSGLGITDALRAANSVRNLLSPPTVQQQAGLPQQSLLGGGQARGVDFSPMYQNTAVGLLPTAELYRRSLI
jgi:hypothetical protein